MWSMPSPTKLQSDYKIKNQVKSMCDDKNCQSNQCVHIQTAVKSCNMQSPELTIPSNYKKVCSEKNCQIYQMLQEKASSETSVQ